MRRFVPFATLLLAGLACVPGRAAEDPGTVATETVDAMNAVWGKHPGTRANHAKGLVVEGSFTPAPGARVLSKAVVFAGPAVSVTARFSDSTGLPSLPDGAPPANPHGLSVKFHLPGGGDMDIVCNSLAFFPVATGAEFRDLLLALGQTKPDSPKPTPVDKFMAAHPAAPKAFATASTPDSFATERYNGIDAFVFVSADGKRQPFRLSIVPVAGEHHLSEAEAGKQKRDFLVDEMRTRLKTQPVRFRLVAQLAAPGDQTRDPTQPWPSDRPMAELGTLTLTRTVADNAAAERALLFLPNNVPAGIELSDDPLVDARVNAYAVSYSRRTE